MTPEDVPSTSHLRLVSPSARRELERRFELRSVLGRGAMGTVLRARDRELGREVALKLPLRGGGERRLARFAREGQITASLHHPAIVAVHSAGVIEDQPWIAYELVEGARTLDMLLDELPLRRRIELIRDAAAGLGHAHAQGVVHRDVKPQNLLVDSAGRLRVADFGLAAAESHEERLTQTGALVGTPHYMAPEQFAAREQVGPPADVWALGVILYEALTGQPPFTGDTLPLLVRQVTQSHPVPPTRLRADTPRELETVCLHALARQPGARYPDGARLAADLEAWLAGTPVSASRSGLFADPERRARVGRWLALGLPLGLAAALLAFALQAGPGEPGQDRPGSPAPSGAGTAPGGSERPPPPDERARTARDRYRQLDALEPAERLAAARSWLELYGDLPQAAEVRAELAGRPHPRRVLTLRHAARGLALATWIRPDALLTWGRDGTIAWWALPDGRLERRWTPGRAPILSLFALNGNLWITDRAGALHVALTPDPSRVTLATTTIDEKSPVLHLAADARGVLAYGGDGWFRIARPEGAISGYDLFDPVRGVQFLSQDRLVAVCGSSLDMVRVAENAVRVYRVADGALQREEQLGFMPNVLAADRTGERFAVGTATGHVFLYAADGSRLRTLAGLHIRAEVAAGSVVTPIPLGCSETVQGLAFTPDGVHLLAAGGTGDDPQRRYELRAWDTGSGAEVWRHLNLERRPGGLVISPDGRWLAIGSEEGEVEVWETGLLN